MRYISLQTLKILQNDPFMKKCCRRLEGGCGGGITFEHAIIYGGKQLDEPWSIIPLCSRHHSVGVYQDNGLLDKRKNEWVALNRATDEELDMISKVKNWKAYRDELNVEYGKPRP